jgi:hypothetical protein
MVRKNRRLLSHVPNVHSLVLSAKSTQKIRGLDCALSFGAMANALSPDENGRNAAAGEAGLSNASRACAGTIREKDPKGGVTASLGAGISASSQGVARDTGKIPPHFLVRPWFQRRLM